MANQTFEQYRSDRAYRLVLVLTGTPNTAGNYSDAAYTLTLYALNSDCAYHYNYGNKLYLALNGQPLIDTANIGRVWHDGISSQQLASGTIRVPHNSDGTKSMAVSAIFQQTQAPDRANYNITGTMVLDTIARSSAPTLSKSSAEFGTAVTISTNRASTGFTHTIKYKFGTKSGTIATGVGDNTSWTIPNSLMSEIPNAASGVIQIICETYSGSALIGTQQVDLTATVPANIVPALTVAVEEAATIPSGISGYIQSRSRLKVTSTGTGQYGASIKSYKTTVEGSDYNGSPVTTNTISGSGIVAVKVVVTDSRGRTTTKTANVTVTAYSPPKLTGVSAYRCVSATSTTADKDGAYICVMPKGSITALGNKNGKTCTVYYKKASAASYSSKALTMGDYVLDTEYVIFAAEADSSYDVYAVLSDSFAGSSTRADAPQVMAAAAYIHIPAKRDGMGLGTRAEGGGMWVGWPTRFLADLITRTSSGGELALHKSTIHAASEVVSFVSTYVSTTYEVSAVVWGCMVHLSGLICLANVNANTMYTIATIKEGYRPIRHVRILNTKMTPNWNAPADMSQGVEVILEPTGTVQINCGSTTNGAFWLEVVYFIN